MKYRMMKKKLKIRISLKTRMQTKQITLKDKKYKYRAIKKYLIRRN